MNIDPATLPESAFHIDAENISAIHLMADALTEWAKIIKGSRTRAISLYNDLGNPVWLRDAAAIEANRLHREQELAERLAERLRNSDNVVIYPAEEAQ